MICSPISIAAVLFLPNSCVSSKPLFEPSSVSDRSKFSCQPRFDFRDHRTIVTGGSRGIGRAIADALGDAGAQVSVFDVAEPDRIKNFPHRFVRIDIADSSAVRTAMAEFLKVPTLLVNNAGITRDRSIAKMSDTDWTAVLNVNLTGTFNMIRAVAPRMAEQGFGRIVNITSINGLRGKFGQANYAAAKAGLIGLTKTAARELGPKGITVNAVAPGMVMTDMARMLPEDILGTAVDEAVLPKLAGPQDISNAVLFLLSDAARCITGEVLRVDSGQYI
jgi:NAD(P)-dependent dehydrogenase (short-subunit alcohol dehydrogenase family)